MSVHRARGLWTGERWLDDAAVVVEDGAIVEVRPGKSTDGPELDGLLLPGLVNAHTHLELTAGGSVQGGKGLSDWVTRIMSRPRPAAGMREAAGRGSAGWLRARGTAAVCDVSNTGDTASWLIDAGLVGVVQHERLGFDRAALPERVADALQPDRVDHGPVGDVVTRPAPHAPYSTAPELLVAASRPGAAPASIHLAEDPAELTFLEEGRGPFADVLDHLGRDWRWWSPPGLGPAQALDALGILGPGLMLVHATWLDPEAIARVAARGAPICLCPRSNLHIGGRLPDVPTMIAAGVRLALGTDSLASAPDLDVLGEVAALNAAFPEVDPTTWLRAATAGGADALRLGAVGRVANGARGLLFAEGVRSPRDLSERTPRRWLLRPTRAAVPSGPDGTVRGERGA